VVNNRFRRGFAEMVSPLCHASLCVIDVADITVDEAFARAWRSALSAYKYAYITTRAGGPNSSRRSAGSAARRSTSTAW
jgi:hypothetical protein